MLEVFHGTVVALRPLKIASVARQEDGPSHPGEA
jgi:hypothetical protein